MGTDEPTLPRLMLGSELRRLRKRAKLQAVDITRLSGIGSTAMSRLEKGLIRCDSSRVAYILGIVKATRQEFADAMALAELTTSGTCTFRHPPGFPDRVGPLLALEAQAGKATFYDPTGVPDLLQSRAYGKAELEAMSDPGSDYGAMLRDRQARQRKFEDLRFLQSTFYLGERGLRHNVGGASVMKDQLSHLTFLASTAQFHIRVVPMEVSPRVFPMPVSMFEYPELSPIVRHETCFTSLLSTCESEVHFYIKEFGKLNDCAMSVSDSIAWMTARIDELSSRVVALDSEEVGVAT